MKAYNKLFAIAVGLFALASCGEQDEENYVAGPADSLNNYGEIWFEKSSASVELAPEDATTYQVKLVRANTEGELDVKLKALGDADVVELPASAHFANGEKETVVEFSFDKSELGKNYSVSIVADESQYMKPFTFNFIRIKWNLVGTGTYTYTLFFSGDDAGLELYQRDDAPSKYKITHWGYDVDFTFTMTSPTNVKVDQLWIGYDHPTYGPVNVKDVGGSQYDAENGVFYFAVSYVVSAGSFGSGYEMFTLDK